MRMQPIGVRYAALVIAFAPVACVPRDHSLPRPVALSQRPMPSITPIPAPDPICIGRMHLGASRPEPKKLVHVQPKFPSLRTRGHFGTMWSGVAEIAPDGSVRAARTTHSTRNRPMAPEWEDAILDALRQWRYEPVCVDGHPVSDPSLT